MQLIKKLILSSFLISLVANPALILAQGNSNTTTGGVSYQNEYTGVEGSIKKYLCTPSETAVGKDVENCINKLYRFGISFGAIAVVFFMVIAGYIYIAGGEAGKAKAKGIFQNSLVGMGILLGTYILLGFINPNLLLFKPIQPPIFNAADLPSCEDVGLQANCVLPSDEPGKAPGAKALSADELRSLQTKFESDFASIGVIPKSKWGGKVPTQPLTGNPTPNTIVVHHTAGSNDTPQGIETFHMSKWSDIGYHFIITKDGKIYQGRYGGPGVQGAHAGGANSGTIGVVLVGNYETESVGNSSKASLQKLVTALKSKYSVNKISIHRDMGTTNTVCPGKNLVPIVKQLAWLEKDLAFSFYDDNTTHE